MYLGLEAPLGFIDVVKVVCQASVVRSTAVEDSEVISVVIGIKLVSISSVVDSSVISSVDGKTVDEGISGSVSPVTK